MKNSDAGIVYHKSSCITCKRTLDEMERLKIDIKKRDFFKDPFSEIELKKIIKLVGKSPYEMLRKRDKMYKELILETKKLSDDKIIKLMVKYPGLIQRPIIIKNEISAIGKTDLKKFQ
ncbi:MAG: ArsC/Spx/MgsR family protein [Nitrosopumilaceae archaeon]|nr:ArsC/Spx/MgsR family protein [Nitrosopumilaceae archaeon]